MKASELIAELQKQVAEHGDLVVTVFRHDDFYADHEAVARVDVTEAGTTTFPGNGICFVIET